MQHNGSGRKRKHTAIKRVVYNESSGRRSSHRRRSCTALLRDSILRFFSELNAQIRSICGAQWRGQTRRTRSWRSTSAGKQGKGARGFERVGEHISTLAAACLKQGSKGKELAHAGLHQPRWPQCTSYHASTSPSPGNMTLLSPRTPPPPPKKKSTNRYNHTPVGRWTARTGWSRQSRPSTCARAAPQP